MNLKEHYAFTNSHALVCVYAFYVNVTDYMHYICYKLLYNGAHKAVFRIIMQHVSPKLFQSLDFSTVYHSSLTLIIFKYMTEEVPLGGGAGYSSICSWMARHWSAAKKACIL